MKMLSSKKLSPERTDRGRDGKILAKQIGPALLVALDVFHRVVIEAEVVTDLVDHGVADELGHLLRIGAILLDRPLIDVDRVGKDIAVGGVAAGEIDAPVEAVEGVGRLDAELLEG